MIFSFCLSRRESILERNKMKYLSIILIVAVAVALIYADDECQQGETKTIACNNCKCIQGNWACTKKICGPAKREVNCTPGETFKQDCNTCVCSPDGKSAACTLRAC